MQNFHRFLPALAAVPVALLGQGSRQVRPDTAALQRLLVAEDARGSGVEGFGPITEALKSSSPLLRTTALRALGRLQRPALAAPLVEALTDPDARVRAIAADALAQAMQGAVRPPGAVTIGEAERALTLSLMAEQNQTTADELARSLGRLPFADSASARRAESAIIEASARASVFGSMRALYSLTRTQRITGPLSVRALEIVRTKGLGAPDVGARRVSLLVLSASRALDSASVIRAFVDKDPQVRRLALGGAVALRPGARDDLVRRAFADSSVLVRLDAPRAARAGSPQPDCSPIHGALGDAAIPVVLAALDALGEPCADSAIVNAKLNAFTAKPRSGPDNLAAGSRQWHAAAHALTSLAHVDSARATRQLPRFVTAGAWQPRAYASRAATTLRDITTLKTLAADTNHNVMEAAIDGLARVAKHEADSIYIAALRSSGYQVQLAAAAALAGSKDANAVPALLDAFDRVSAERRENAHDARMAMLTRLAELGSPARAARLSSYATDFDSTIAMRTAELLTKWTGTKVTARPTPLEIRHEPLAPFALSADLRLRITMATGGVILVRLHSDEAPATVARIVRLAHAHYYDGLTIHRVVPNFVIQGGSPDATEYVGDGPFMRDELGSRSHDRGTLGISTRGRDTGDAQFFVNLVDNPRLDHDYTVFGTIISGLAVADGVIEGDTIARVEVIGRAVPR